MKLYNEKLLAVAALAAVVGSAHAIDVDGTAEAAYGSPLFTQNVGTGFGNSTSGSPVVATGGSELDGFYGLQDAANLYGVATGNLESNFNHQIFFFDTGSGGVNTIGNDNASTADFGYLNSLAGITFDAGFSASHALWIRNGGDPNTLYISFARLGSSGSDVFDIASAAPADTTTIRVASTTGFTGALNNSNVGGVDGNTGGASSGAGVTTGFEFSLAKSLLDNPTGSIRVAGFITGGSFLSNQVIGGLPTGTGNLGNSPPANFAQIAGDQFASVAPVPEPVSMLALGLGAAAMLRRRKK